MALPALLALLWSAILELTVAAATSPVPTVQQLLAQADADAAGLNADPGQALKVRQAPLLNRTVGHARVAYQLLYRTTDSRYDPSWAVTTLLIPRTLALPSSSSNSASNSSSSAESAVPVLSYQLPYDTCDVDASPSFAVRFGEPYGEIAPALSRGWLVVVPDYEGPLASYAAGVQAGHATLDGVCAVLAVASVGTAGVSARVALWGVTAYLNRREGAGLIPQGLLGISTQHPDARAWILSRLKPSLRDVFLSATRMTAAQSILAFQYQDIYGYFVGGYADLHTPVMEMMYNVDGYIGYHGLPRMPVFIYNAIHDELIDIRDVDALVDRFCGVGANILYHRNTAGAHAQELFDGRQRAFEWLRSVLDGTYGQRYPSIGCTVLNVTLDLAPWVG
ncbi:hypothetical protein VTG60DRAFT_103 [Thermothelomyces hinnuleus]